MATILISEERKLRELPWMPTSDIGSLFPGFKVGLVNEPEHLLRAIDTHHPRLVLMHFFGPGFLSFYRALRKELERMLDGPPMVIIYAQYDQDMKVPRRARRLIALREKLRRWGVTDVLAEPKDMGGFPNFHQQILDHLEIRV